MRAPAAFCQILSTCRVICCVSRAAVCRIRQWACSTLMYRRESPVFCTLCAATRDAQTRRAPRWPQDCCIEARAAASAAQTLHTLGFRAHPGSSGRPSRERNRGTCAAHRRAGSGDTRACACRDPCFSPIHTSRRQQSIAAPQWCCEHVGARRRITLQGRRWLPKPQ